MKEWRGEGMTKSKDGWMKGRRGGREEGWRGGGVEG